MSSAKRSESSGLISRLDPRTRVIAAVIFALAAVAAHTLVAQGLALALALALALLARLPLGRTLRRLVALEGFMLLAVATLPFTMTATPVAEIAGWPVGADGLRRALSILLVANGVMLALQALLGGLEMVELGHALARLGAPERLVALMLFTIRYVDVLQQEFARLRLAMRARGFRPRTGWHTWRSFGWLVGMLLVKSLERSERIHAAMRLRGFTGRFHALDHGAVGALDWGFGAAHAASVTLVLTMGLM